MCSSRRDSGRYPLSVNVVSCIQPSSCLIYLFSISSSSIPSVNVIFSSVFFNLVNRSSFTLESSPMNSGNVFNWVRSNDGSSMIANNTVKNFFAFTVPVRCLIDEVIVKDSSSLMIAGSLVSDRLKCRCVMFFALAGSLNKCLYSLIALISELIVSLLLNMIFAAASFQLLQTRRHWPSWAVDSILVKIIRSSSSLNNVLVPLIKV